ncbi:unnamed protein product [Enterobius vermicularis]|uniref:Uncharacterized protein n=1 Tax=Enterobius vermicularis TaxID=51028 RepID=A0A0N4VP77_ENTVE|nr:unnamed protein product [Enterobius vermicularis]
MQQMKNSIIFDAFIAEDFRGKERRLRGVSIPCYTPGSGASFAHPKPPLSSICSNSPIVHYGPSVANRVSHSTSVNLSREAIQRRLLDRWNRILAKYSAPTCQETYTKPPNTTISQNPPGTLRTNQTMLEVIARGGAMETSSIPATTSAVGQFPAISKSGGSSTSSGVSSASKHLSSSVSTLSVLGQNSDVRQQLPKTPSDESLK